MNTNLSGHHVCKIQEKDQTRTHAHEKNLAPQGLLEHQQWQISRGVSLPLVIVIVSDVAAELCVAESLSS